jgi:glycine/D-amino acid oxidase-like deaminating enzyme
VTDPYWLEEPREPLPFIRLDRRADVEVVGGGVTGCSCALALAKAGFRVRLHEAREIAGGASGRNGGFALRGGAMAYDRTREWLGPERAREYWRLTEHYVDVAEKLGGDAFRRTGSLRLAVDAEERDELRSEYDALREDGFSAEWRRALVGPLADRVTAAIFYPEDATLQPARFVRRLAGAAARAGVEVRERSRVRALEELEADRVVVATDGYPSGLLGELEGLIVPTRGQMIATEPLDELLFEVPHYGRHGFDYWHQRPDGRLLAGGFRDYAIDSEFTADEVTTAPIQAALERFVTELIGREPRITHRWAGIFGLVLDFLPVVGPLPGDDRVWVAGGYSGHGNVLGLMCGALVAAALAGDRHPLLDAFAPARLLQVEQGQV